MMDKDDAIMEDSLEIPMESIIAFVFTESSKFFCWLIVMVVLSWSSFQSRVTCREHGDFFNDVIRQQRQ